ncbi:hypothetical protein ACFL3T_02320 [Patescibacteria group bacterium]
MTEQQSGPRDPRDETLETMAAFISVGEEAKDYSPEYSPEFVAEVKQSLADDVLTKRMVRAIFNWETESEARKMFEAVKAGRESGQKVEAVLQEFSERREQLLNPDAGLSSEQYLDEVETLDAEFKKRLAALGVTDAILKL